MKRTLILLLAVATLGLAVTNGSHIPWNIAKKLGGGTGTGTVSSLAQGYLMSFSANPITTTGTVSFDTTAFKLWYSSAVKGWATGYVMNGYGVTRTVVGDTVRLGADTANLRSWAVTVKTNTSWLADTAINLRGGIVDPTAFHHGSFADTSYSLHSETTYSRILLLENKPFRISGVPTLRLHDNITGTNLAVPGVSSLFSLWDSTTSIYNNIYSEGFEVVDTNKQNLGDSMTNPSYRAYFGFAYNDRGLSGAKNPSALIVQMDSAQARAEAETTGGRVASLVVLGSTAGKFSDTSYVSSSAGIYTDKTIRSPRQPCVTIYSARVDTLTVLYTTWADTVIESEDIGGWHAAANKDTIVSPYTGKISVEVCIYGDSTAGHQYIVANLMVGSTLYPIIGYSANLNPSPLRATFLEIPVTAADKIYLTAKAQGPPVTPIYGGAANTSYIRVVLAR